MPPIDPNKVFFAGADYSLSESELGAAFARHGRVIQCKLFTDEHGRSKGCGLVTYCDDGDAERAILALHGYNLGHRRLVVRQAEVRERPSAPRSETWGRPRT
jgi:RNA recognition motif-containing protein